MTIAATPDGMTYDPFFKGSYTYVGDNMRGNHSLNVKHKHQFGINPMGAKVGKEVYMYTEEHSGVIKEHFNEGAKKVVEQGGLILPWSREFTEVILEPEFHQHIICAQKPELIEKYGNKQSLKEILKEQGIAQADFEIMKGAEIIYMIEQGHIPHEREVVVQSPYGINGKGTMILSKKEQGDPWKQSVKDINPEQDYVVSEYVKTISSPSVHMQISSNEIGMYPVGDQLVVSGQTQGTSFDTFAARPQSTQQATRDVAMQVAELAQKDGYRGFINVDTMITDDERYPEALVTETNTGRYSGTAGLANVAARRTERMTGQEIGSVFDHSVEALYKKETDFSKRIAMIPAIGSKRDGPAERSPSGEIIIPQEYQGINHDGLEQTRTEDEWGLKFSYITYQMPPEQERTK